MPDYRRPKISGGTFFFTLVTEDRAPIFTTPLSRKLLHDAIAACQATRPFDLLAIVLLLDHLHALIQLPDGDIDFSTRWSYIKSHFTRSWLGHDGEEATRTGSRVHNRRRGVWQRRFYDHAIRDNDDLNRHLDYIHFTPVKHGLVGCPHSWPYSSFQKWVNAGSYISTWGCSCDGKKVEASDFRWTDELGME
jgi:putative transposase